MNPPLNVNDFAAVTAQYRAEAVPRLAGNRYVEALPPLPDDTELAKALRYLPRFDPQERLLPAPVRIQMLDTLQRLVIPLPRLIRLARAVFKMMRTGYAPRRPFSKEDQAILQQLYLQQQTGSFVSVRQTALAAQHSMALMGSSGCGKSYSLRHIAGLFPQVIYHPELGKWQLPCLFIEMSYDGESVHTLASALFEELDRLLPDAGYTELYMQHKGLNAEQRLHTALAKAYEHGAGMIFVDESQNQKDIEKDPGRKPRRNASAHRAKNETPLTKLLITASNTSHIPMLMSGTLEMQSMMGARFSRARRMAGRGSAVWLPLESSGKLQVPNEFELMLKSLWHYQWVQKPVALTDDWVEVFFKLTQGIPDIMVKLFESSQEAAIAGKSEELTPALVELVFSKEFVTTEFGIIGLRDKDRVLLDAVTDLYQPDAVEEARAAQTQFQAPSAGAITPKAPKGHRGAAATTARPRAAKSPLASPTAAEVPADVAVQADLRRTLTDDPQAPSLNRVEGATAEAQPA